MSMRKNNILRSEPPRDTLAARWPAVQTKCEPSAIIMPVDPCIRLLSCPQYADHVGRACTYNWSQFKVNGLPVILEWLTTIANDSCTRLTLSSSSFRSTGPMSTRGSRRFTFEAEAGPPSRGRPLQEVVLVHLHPSCHAFITFTVAVSCW